MKCIFTIDVEDWFHILDVPSTPDISQWHLLPSRIEHNFLRLLDILDETNDRATCFFLGWVAERFPNLVRETVQRGHEVASHGYSHQLAFRLTAAQFLSDAVRSRNILQDVSGQPVLGYRASGFSVTMETPWFFEKLMEAGYRYDSSVFPAPHGHGGLKSVHLSPYGIGESGTFIEFPVTVERIAGKPICFFGGGYLRIFPYSLIRFMTRKVLKKGRPVIFYIHPREIDPGHPRLPMGWKRRFKSYSNLASTEGKIKKLLAEFKTITFSDFLATEFQSMSNGSYPRLDTKPVDSYESSHTDLGVAPHED